MLKALIFDSGGTLVDTSAWYSDEAYRRYVNILHSLGYTVELKRCREAFADAKEAIEKRYEVSPLKHQIGLIFTEACRYMGVRIDPAIATRVDYDVLYSLIDLARLYPDALEALEHVKSTGLPMAVVTNGSVLRTRSILTKLGIRDYFDHVLVSEEIGYEKFTGIPFRRILTRLGTTPDEALVVGNCPKEDIAGAQKVGIKTVLVHKKRSDARKLGVKPDFVIKELSELKGILQKMDVGVKQVA